MIEAELHADAESVESGDNIFPMTLNMSVKEKMDSKQLLHCYHVFKTRRSKDKHNLDHSFSLARNLCLPNSVDRQQLASKKTLNELRYLTFPRVCCSLSLKLLY